MRACRYDLNCPNCDQDCENYIELIPLIHGTWVGSADGYADGELVYDMWECSNCGWDVDGADEKPDFQWCPKCGCCMDG